jgi:hypothetical protein
VRLEGIRAARQARTQLASWFAKTQPGRASKTGAGALTRIACGPAIFSVGMPFKFPRYASVEGVAEGKSALGTGEKPDQLLPNRPGRI